MYQLSADFGGWFRQKGKSRKTFDIIMSTKFVFLTFRFGSGGGGWEGAQPFLCVRDLYGLICVFTV
jgi:hypothetical protein